MTSKEREYQKWRMEMTRKEIMLTRQRETRKCKLCGNRHPLTAQYFMPTDKPNIPGLISGGLLFVCKSCQAHWGPNLKADVNRLASEMNANLKAAQYVKPLAERITGGR